MLFFIGMVLQFKNRHPLSALFFYRRSLFDGLHPITFWRISECFSELGLFWRALKYLERAYKMSGGQIPSIERKYEGKKRAVVMAVESTRCGVCGEMGGVDSPLFACSGCLGVFYCGRRCQKIGWNRGHRRECGGYSLGFKQGLKEMKEAQIDKQYSH